MNWGSQYDDEIYTENDVFSQLVHMNVSILLHFIFKYNIVY